MILEKGTVALSPKRPVPMVLTMGFTSVIRPQLHLAALVDVRLSIELF
jgi:hypothetical protein